MKTNLKESEISEHLSAAWNIFIKLKQTHPDHLSEFKKSIHDAQKILMWRELQRINPEKYPTYSQDAKISN